MEPKYPWGKLLIYTLAVVLPAATISISTYYALYDSFWIILMMLIISVGIAGVFTYYSGDATPKISRYCIIAAIVVGVVMSAGLIIHVLLSRELAIAIQDVDESRKAEDRADRRQREAAQVTADLLAKQAELETAQRNRLRAEAVRNDSARRLGLRPSQPASLPLPSVPSSLTSNAPEMGATNEESTPVKPITPTQIRHKYSGWLIGAAIADVLSSVIAGLVLAGRWEWDRDHDGIDDRKQGQRRVNPLPAPQAVTARDSSDPKA